MTGLPSTNSGKSAITFVPPLLFSTTLVTVSLGTTSSTRGAENSDVFPAGSVAVELRTGLVTSPDTTSAHVPLPVPSVKEVVLPRKVSPSPNPLGSPTLLLNRSIAKLVLAVESIVPLIVVLTPSKEAAVINGKFCRRFVPVSASPGSLGVTPSRIKSLLRSIPKPPLSKMALDRMALFSGKTPSSRLLATPFPRLWAITLPDVGSLPPTVLFEPRIKMP